MLTRLYIDNWRSFVNFELELDGVNLFLGDNGSGKTGVFDLLRILKKFVLEREPLARVLPRTSCTRWESRREQKFELHLAGSEGMYRYELLVEHDARQPERARVLREALFHDAACLGEFTRGSVTPHRDDGGKVTPYLADWGFSGIGTIVPTEENPKLAWFRGRLANVHALHVDPRHIEPWSDGAAAQPADDLANFAAWFRGLQQRKFLAVSRMFAALKEALPEFEELVIDSDQHERARLRMVCRPAGGPLQSFDFAELSDGQRALAVLYAIRHALIVPDTTVGLDEPDNFLALREIQPWLYSVLEEALTSSGAQVFLISHNAELINHLARDHGLWFSRERGGPTRVRRYAETMEGPLSPSEQVAQGVDP